MNIIKSHKELEVFQLSFKLSMQIFLFTKTFPKEETYALTSQVRRSSRSVFWSRSSRNTSVVGLFIRMWLYY